MNPVNQIVFVFSTTILGALEILTNGYLMVAWLKVSREWTLINMLLYTQCCIAWLDGFSVFVDMKITWDTSDAFCTIFGIVSGTFALTILYLSIFICLLRLLYIKKPRWALVVDTHRFISYIPIAVAMILYGPSRFIFFDNKKEPTFMICTRQELQSENLTPVYIMAGTLIVAGIVSYWKIYQVLKTNQRTDKRTFSFVDAWISGQIMLTSMACSSTFTTANILASIFSPALREFVLYAPLMRHFVGVSQGIIYLQVHRKRARVAVILEESQGNIFLITLNGRSRPAEQGIYIGPAPQSQNSPSATTRY